MPPSNFTGQCNSNLGPNAPVTSGPLRISYYDPDGLKNTVITYSIVDVTPSSGIGLFNIGTTNCQITTARVLDVDNNKPMVFILTVRIKDEGGHSSDLQVKMSIEDVNDNSPIPVQSPYNVSINETVPSQTPIADLNITFTDADSGANAQFTYTLQPSVNFTLDNDTNDTTLFTNRVFDYETDIRQYNLKLIANDLGDPTKSGTATIIIDILDLNDNEPLITATSDAVFTESGPPVPIADINITDPDSSLYPMRYAVVIIDNWLDSGERLGLAGPLPPGFNSINEDYRLLIYGDGSTQEYADILSNVTYQNNEEELSSPAVGRQITFFISDLEYDSESLGWGSFFNNTYYQLSNVSINISLITVNDRPSVNCISTLLLPEINEDTPVSTNNGANISSTNIASVITDNDDDSSAIGIAVVSVTGDGQWQYRLSGSPSFTNITGVSQSSVTLLSPDTIVRFLPSSHTHGSASFTFKAWDMSDGLSPGTTGVDSTASQADSSFSTGLCSAGLEVLPINDRPVLDLDMGGPDSPNYTTSYTENQSPSLIFLADMSDIRIIDVDHDFLQSLTVTISKIDGSCDLPDYPYDVSEDYLHPANLSMLGFTQTLSMNDKACRTYTYSGNETTDNWEWFIGMLRLSINNTEPSDHTRRIQYVINDGDADSVPVYSFVSVTLVSDNCPSLTFNVSSHLSYPEHGSAIAVDSMISVNDDDYKAVIDSVVITISVSDSSFDCSGCVLAVNTSGATSITSTYDNSTLTIEGPASTVEFQTVLRTLTFRDTQSEPTFGPMATLSFDIRDSTASSCPTDDGDITIVLQPVNDLPPNLMLDGTHSNYSVTFVEDNAAGVVIVGQVTADDPDTIDSSSYNITIEISEGFVSTEDELVVVGPISPATLISATSQEIIIQSSLINLPAALRTLRYRNTNSFTPSTHNRLVMFTASDEGMLSDPVFTIISVVSTNDPPSLDLDSTNPLTRDVSVEFDVSGPAVDITPLSLITDPDGNTLASMRLVLREVDENGNSINRQDIAQESLGFTAVPGISGQYIQSTGILSFTGSSLLSNYQTLLRSVSYSNTRTNPSLNLRKVEVTINDGSGTSVAMVTIRLGDVPTAPVVDLDGDTSQSLNNEASYTTKTGSPVRIATSDATITDMDNDNICSMTLSYPASRTCTESALSVSTPFGDMSLSVSTVNSRYVYRISTSFEACRESIAFVSILRTITFEAPDTAPAGTCGVSVSVTDVRNSTSASSLATVVVTVGNEPPYIDLDLGRVGRHFTFEYIQGIDDLSHIVSIYNETLANNISSLTPVGEAPGEASLSSEFGAVLITNLSHAGYILIDEDSEELEYLSVKFLYLTVSELRNDAIRFPCIPNNSSLFIDPIGCTRYRQSVTYTNLTCDPDVFDSCNNLVDLCTDLRVTISCSSKEYKFEYLNSANVSRYSTLLGNLAYQYTSNETVFTPIERTINVTASDGHSLSIGAFVGLRIIAQDDAPVIVVQTPAFRMYENDIPNRNPNPIYYTIPIYHPHPDYRPAPRGTYRVSLVGGDDGVFSVSDEGDIRLIGHLDYEEKSMYYIEVSALFNGADPRTATTGTVVVEIVDYNDNAPEVQNSFTVYVYENRISEFVVEVNATDRDQGLNAQLVYSPLLGIGHELFTVNRTTGIISTSQPLNVSLIDYYLLVLIVHDMGEIPLYTHTVINVHVLPTPPARLVITSNLPSTINILENVSFFGFPGALQASEEGTDDSSRVRYRIAGTVPPNSDIIRIDPSNGTLSLVGPLDAETETEYIIMLEAYSTRTDTEVMSAFQNITINVQDVDESFPAFDPPGPYRLDIPENEPTGSIILQLSANDSDVTPHQFVFGPVGTPPQAFNVLSNGSIIFVGPLDFEGQSSYTFGVQVYDNAGLVSQITTTMITVNVTNVNDHPPSFTGTPYTTSVRETASNGSIVFDVTITDLDGSGFNSNITFSILETNTPFCMDDYRIMVCNSNQLTSNETVGVVFNLTVIVTERDGSIEFTNQTPVLIELILINEYPPSFTSAGNIPSIDEFYGSCSFNSSIPGTFLQDYVAVDNRDGGESITYSLANDYGGQFRINQTTGRLVADECIDAEVQRNYNLIIVATDKADVDGTTHNVTHNAALQVIDINDHPPVVHGPFTFTVRENETENEFVFGYLSITDDDATNIRGNNVVSVRRQGTGNVGDGTPDCPSDIRIEVHETNFGLSFCQSVDYETDPHQYSITLVARNGEEARPTDLAVTFTVTVNVVDKNEHRPFIEGSNFLFDIRENQPVNTGVGHVPATDDDHSDADGGMIEYFLSIYDVVGRNDSCTSDLPFYATSNGTITTCYELNYEDRQLYPFYVSVCDRGNPSLCTIRAENVTVNVIDLNDNPPVVPADHINITLPENDTDRVLLTVTWTDGDSDINSNATVILNTTGTPFGINENDQLVVTNSNAIDYETGVRLYPLLICIRNPPGDPADVIQITCIRVDVTIADINDITPAIPLPYQYTIDENQNITINVNATDNEEGDNGRLSYTTTSSFISTDCSLATTVFSLSSTTGYITSCKALDYEAAHSYSFTIEACDNGVPQLCSNATYDINIIDLNDNPPVVPADHINITLPENDTDRVLLMVTWTDGDSDINSNATVILNTTGTPFGINENNQLVVIDSNAIDYETGVRLYPLLICIRNPPADPADELQITCIRVDITISDINDITPAIPPPYQYTINENQNITINVNATDVEEGNNGRLTYTTTSSFISTDCSLATTIFSLNSTTGYITSCKPLDYEAAHSYSFTIEVCDNGVPQLCSDATYDINIIDLNDNPPLFPSDVITIDIYENLPSGTLLYNILTTDRDSDINSNVTYSFINSSSPFGIRDDNEIYYTGLAPVDYDNGQKVYMITLIATNRPAIVSDATQVTDIILTINVIDRNDLPPVFPVPIDRASVTENMTEGSMIYFLNTTDGDSANNSAVSYRLLSQNTPFSVQDNAIVVEDRQALDRETLSSYYDVQLEAINPPGLPGDVFQYANLTVNFTIEDINDNRPQFFGSSRFQVAENRRIDYVIPGRVQARDPDEGHNGLVVFTIEGSTACRCSGNSGCVSGLGDPGSGYELGSGGDPICDITFPFEIDHDNGRLSVCHSLDYEEYCEYTLVVQACDLGSPSLCNMTDIIVSVSDINDNFPTINEPFTMMVNETAQPNVIVDCLNATDPDTGLGGVLRFYSNNVDECSSDFPFEVIADTGCVRVCHSLNFEETRMYHFTASVNDLGTPRLETNDTITIFIVNINDHGPNITSSNTASVPENAINEFVIEVTATDDDHVPFNDLFFTLLDDANGRFNMTMDGRIYTAVPLDREMFPQHDIEVQVSDFVFNARQSISVSVEDVNDQRPYYAGPLSFSAQEESIVTLSLDFRDNDTGINAQVYISNTSDEFIPVHNSLNITSIVRLDRDPPNGNAVHMIEVIASDRGNPSLSSDPVRLILSITDTNDNAPVPLPPFTSAVRDNTPSNTYITTLNATDYDEGVNAEVRFTLLNHTDMFFLNETTGDLYTNTIVELIGTMAQTDYLGIRVSDFGNPPQSTDYTFTVVVIDNLPIFVPNTYEFTIEENDFNSEVGQVYAIDRDLNSEDADFVYSIVSSNPYKGFAIINNTIISPDGYLDYESSRQFTLTVGVGNEEMVFDTATVTIYINDTNDNTPFLSPVNVTAVLPENSPVGYKVTQVVAIDYDSGPCGTITYTIYWGQGRHLFKIDQDGSVRTTSLQASDYENRTNYLFRYKACDGCVPQCCSSPGYIIISVIDSDDVPPVINRDISYSLNLSESFPTNSEILTVEVSDVDTPVNELTFSLVPEQTLFQIQQVTGILSTTDVPLDYETTTLHTFSVVVTDTAGSSDTVQLTITITDVDDNRPYITAPTVPSLIFTFNETQSGPLSFNPLTLVEPDEVGQNAMDRVVMSLRVSPNYTLSYPIDGGYCDHANYTVTNNNNIVDNTSFSRCYLSGQCIDIDKRLQSLGGTSSNGIFNLTTGSFRTTTSSATEISLRSNFTISLWVKAQSVTRALGGIIFSFEEINNVILRGVILPNGGIRVVSASNALIIESDAGVSVLDNEYHQITFVRYNTTVYLYVDAVLSGSSTNGRSIVDNGESRALFIGESLVGYIAQFRFCSGYSLSREETVCTVSCGEILNAQSTQNITATADYRTRTVSLTCNTPDSCSVTEFNAALNTVTYTNNIDEPHPLQRGLYTYARDVIGIGPVRVFSIEPVLVNDKRPVLDINGPAVSGIDYSLEYEEVSGPQPIVPSVAVLYDLDSGYWNFRNISVVLLNPSVGNEFLSFSSTDLPAGLSITQVSAVSLLVQSTVTGQDLSPEVFIEGLRAITYSNVLKNPQNPTRRISFTVYDEGSVHNNDPLSFVIVNIILVNDPPELTVPTTSVTFSERSRSLTLLQSVGVSLTDPDSTNMGSAVFRLENTDNANEESLSLSSSSISGINSTYDSSTGILVINGSATINNYITIIKSVVYSNNNLNPTTNQRRITLYVADDKGRVSNSSSFVINIMQYNDPGILVFGSTGTNQYYTDFIEDTDDCVSVFGSNFSLIDPEGRGFTLIEVRVVNSRPGERFLHQTSISSSFVLPFSPSHTVVFINVDDDYNEILRRIMYCNDNEEPIGGQRMITLTITDREPPGGSRATTSGQTFINIINVNDPPQLEVQAAEGLVFGRNPVKIFQNNMNLTDHDNTTFTGFNATITNPQDSIQDEAILSLGDLIGQGIFRGPDVLPNGSYVFFAIYLSPINVSAIVHDMQSLQYNNEAGVNITINPPRIVCLQAFDGETGSNIGCVTIHVDLPNTAAPRFLNATQDFTYSETHSSITVGRFVAVDPDIDPVASIVSYSIESIVSFDSVGVATSADTGIFAIGSETGLLTIPNGLDAEMFMFHNVCIKAEDNGNPRESGLLCLTFEVQDVNDNAPQFTMLPYTPNAATAREEFVPYTERRNLYTVTATDADITDSNNQITFGLVNTYYTTLGLPIFHMENTTGILYYDQRLDAEQEEVFIFNVSATDNGSPTLVSYTIISFIPIDINDNPAAINQLTPALFVQGLDTHASSIGPAMRVTDRDDEILLQSVTVQLTDPYIVTDYLTCMGSGGCQEQRVNLTSAINLFELATFTGLGVTNITLGAAQCSAKNFVRLSGNNGADGYGRIPRSSLNGTSFATGEFSFSFVANITNEGHIVGITDNTDPNANPSNVNIVFGIWFRRNRMSLIYTNTGGTRFTDTLTLSGSNIIFDVPTGFYINRHYTVVVRTGSSGPMVEFYSNCQSVGSVLLSSGQLPAVPNVNADVFIGRTIPGTSSNDNIGHRHLGGNLHGLYYYPYPLTTSQISSICACESLVTPSQYSNDITVTQSNLFTISISSSGSTALPPKDVNDALRAIYYTSVLDESIAGSNRSLRFTTDYSDATITQSESTTGSIIYIESDTSVPVIDLNGDQVGLNYSASFTEGSSSVSIVNNSMTITRIISAPNVLPTIDRIVVELVNPVDGLDETITGASVGFINLTSQSNRMIEITGPGLPDEFIQVIRTIRYENINDNLTTSVTRNISFTVYDTEGRWNSPLSYTEVTVISTEDPPQLSLSSSIGDTVRTVQFNENGSQVLLAPNLTISDVDSVSFSSVHVAIIENFVANHDRLSVSTVGSIASYYDSASGVLTLNGSASLNEYVTVLRSLAFDTTDNPILDFGTSIPMREITISINDGLLDSNSVSVYIDFIPSDDPTRLILNGSSIIYYTEGSPEIHLLPYAYISDTDNTIVQRIVIQLNGQISGDGLISGGATQIIFSYASRTITDLDAILRALTFINTVNETTLDNRTVTITLTDLAGSVTTTNIVIVVLDRNDNIPQFIGTPYSFDINENSPVGTEVGVIDSLDADATPTFIYFNLTGTQFSLERINEMTARVRSTRVFNYETDPHLIVLTVTASDGELTGTGVVNVRIIDVNEAPTLAITGTSTAAAVQQSRPLLYDNSVYIADQDYNDNITSATLTLSNVPAGSNESLTLNDTLSDYTFTSTTTDSSTVYTLRRVNESSISVSEALEYVYYTAGNILSPLVVRSVSITVSDERGLSSNIVRISVTLADEPVFSHSPYTASLDEARLYSDFLQIQATVANPNDTITYLTDNSYQITINGSTGYLSLDQELDYESVRSFSFNVFAVASVPLPRTATATVYITVMDVNDVPPELEDVSNITVPVGVPTLLFPNATIEDPDTYPLESVTIQLFSDEPIPPNPFTGQACVDEPNIITKMVSIGGLSDDFINLLHYNDTHDGAVLSTDEYDNTILTTNNGHAAINTSLFTGITDQFFFALWLKPTTNSSGFIIYYGDSYGTKYFAVYYDHILNRFEVTLKIAGVAGPSSQVTLIFQLKVRIDDGSWHFLVIKYQSRNMSLSVDGVVVTCIAVVYADVVDSSVCNPAYSEL